MTFSAAITPREIALLAVLLTGVPALVLPAESYCKIGKEVVVGLGDGVTMRTCMWEKETGATIRTGSLELVKNDILILRSHSDESGRLHGEFIVWSDEGVIIKNGSYNEGLKHGPWLTTDINGISTILVYQQGKIVEP